MPIYEFKCEKCGKVVEELVRSSSSSAPKCVECGVEMVRLISSPASIIFKGSGYYTTDYGKGKTFKEKKKREDSGSSESESVDKKVESSNSTSSTKKE